MATLQQQLGRSKAINPLNLERILFNLLSSLEKEMADFNRAQLHEDSQDIFGEAMGFYSLATERITTMEWEAGQRRESEIKEAGDPYDFKDTGTFLPSIYAKVSNNIVTFGATDPKLDEILDNVNLLSDSFFGLTDENRTKLIQEKLKPHLLQEARDLLGV